MLKDPVRLSNSQSLAYEQGTLALSSLSPTFISDNRLCTVVASTQKRWMRTKGGFADKSGIFNPVPTAWGGTHPLLTIELLTGALVHKVLLSITRHRAYTQCIRKEGNIALMLPLRYEW